jgi:hypothetical protein
MNKTFTINESKKKAEKRKRENKKRIIVTGKWRR